MDYSKLLSKRDLILNKNDNINEALLKKMNASFRIEYAHNSTAIEGNTLTLIETKLLLEDKISVGGKALREIYEVINHDKAYEYILHSIEGRIPLEENIVKDIHEIVMENIISGGVYRNHEVRITGANHTPPAGMEMYSLIKNFYLDLAEKKNINSIELAAWTHAEFVRIHPFGDGNGRTARLIMNYQLLENKFLPISIKKENRLDYYNVLEEYAVNRNLDPFINMLALLEDEQLDNSIKEISFEPEGTLIKKFYKSMEAQNNDVTDQNIEI